jgi:hypothetical protein
MKGQNMTDSSENIRRHLIATGQPAEALAQAEQKWTTDQLREEFEVIGFMAPFVVVVRKADGVKGSMEFAGSPRYYFDFKPHEKKG